jgi:nitrogen fixation protein NifB
MSPRLPVVGGAAAPREASNCRLSGGCGTAPASDLPQDVWEKVQDHPCYSEQAHHHFARMHVAVAPACNIQCHYCNRKYDCSNESRPGVVSERLTPEQALRKVLAVAAEVPQLSVVGIAGPGDPLANVDRTFGTMELIAKAAPDLRLCLSTNGLALPDHVDRIAALGVDHVTVTVNMVDPEIGARIYPWVIWNHRKVRGVEGARILHERQMEGLERLREKKILVKVNSVLIPGVNDAHLPEVSRAVKARGAFLHNIMPLISAPEHGTHYGLTGQRGPTDAELDAVQRSCEGDARLMRHCRQCRADAVGLLGQDRNAEFTLAQLPPAPAQNAADVRAAYRAAVERRRAAQEDDKQAALRAVGDVDPALTVRVAVATKGEGLVNEHFGHAHEFLIYEVSRAGPKLLRHRKVEHYCQGGYGEDDALESVVRTIADCHAVLVAKIGRCPREELERAGIEPVDGHAFEPIEASVVAWFGRLAARLARGEVAAPAPRPDPDAAGRAVA